jgi:hypothetical protein
VVVVVVDNLVFLEELVAPEEPAVEEMAVEIALLEQMEPVTPVPAEVVVAFNQLLEMVETVQAELLSFVIHQHFPSLVEPDSLSQPQLPALTK